MAVVRILSFVAFVVVFENVLAITDEQTEEIKKHFFEVGAKCIEDNHLNAEELIVFKEKNLPENENTGCFLSCVFKEVGIFDEKGNLIELEPKYAKKLFDNEEDQGLEDFEEWITSCKKVNEEDVSDGEKGCDRAKLAFSCLAESTEKFGINVFN